MRHLKIFMAILVAILTAPGARAADYTDANGLTYTYRQNVPYTMGDLASVVSGYFLTKVPSGAVNVTIPSTVGGESVVGIDEGAFTNCLSTIKTLTMPSLRTGIPRRMLKNAVQLESVDWGNYMPYVIGYEAFYGCLKLSSISLRLGQGGYTKIGTSAFQGCRALSVTVDLAGSGSLGRFVLGSSAFYGTSVVIDARRWDNVAPGEPTVVSADCQVLVKDGLGEHYRNSSAWRLGTIVDNGPTYTNYSVTAVNAENGVNVFDGSQWTTLDSASPSLRQLIDKSKTVIVSIPQAGFKSLLMNGVEIKGNTDYFDESLSYPDGHVEDVYMFEDLADDEVSLVVVYGAANGVIHFADPAVEAICVANWDTDHDGFLTQDEAAAVTSLRVGGATRSVFYNNQTITSFDELQYFTGLSAIEANAFYLCKSLKSIVFPKTVTTVGEYAFQTCVNLQSVVLNEGLKTINPYAFASCTSLKAISLPLSLETINQEAFGNSGLKSLFIPANVSSIMDDATMSSIPYIASQELPAIVVDENNPWYDSRDNSLAVIRKSSPVTLVVGCKNTVIPEGVEQIGFGAFYYSGKTELVIPASVTSIGKLSLFGSENLERLIMKRAEPIPFDGQIFGRMPKQYPVHCTLQVPVGTRDAYIAAGWTEDIFKGGVVEAADGGAGTPGDVDGNGQVDIVDVTKLVDKILGKD